MPTNADSVTVELIAKTGKYEADLQRAATVAAGSFDRTAKAADVAEAAISRASARVANGQRNLGRQFADIGASLSSGSSPFVVAAQQLPQVADALVDTGGKAARFATLLTGPVGAAALALGSILATTLIPKLLESGDSVDSLVKKLEENAKKTELARQAKIVFANSAAGAAAAVRDLSDALDKENSSTQRSTFLTLAKAEAYRQVSIQALTAAEATAELTRNQARQARGTTFGAGGGAGAGIAAGLYSRQEAAAERDLADAKRKRAAAENAVVKAQAPIIQQRVAESLDAATAATGRYERASDLLYRKLAQGKITADQYQASLTKLARRRDAAIEAAQDADKKGRRGPSAETLAKRAEAARVREVRDNEAFNRDLETLNGQIIAAQRERAITAEDQARFEREAIETEFRKRRDAIAADLSAGKYTAAQAAELNERNEYAKILKLRNVAINEDVRTLQDLARQDAVTIGVLQEQAQAQLAIAETQEERKNIELELIRLKYQERKEQLEYLRAQAQLRGDLQAQNNAQDQLDALPGLERAERTGVDQRNRGRYEQYRRNLDSADALRDSIDGVQIRTLEAVTDELTNATKAALGLKGAFGDIVGELIRIGIQRRLIGPLADALFGPAGGGTSGGTGALGSIFAAIGGGFGGGRASGGDVSAGKLYKINESGPELFQPAQSGKIYPTGSLQAKMGGQRGNTIVQQTFTLDARGGITTPELLKFVNDTARREAATAGKAAYQASPQRVSQFQTLGS